MKPHAVDQAWSAERRRLLAEVDRQARSLARESGGRPLSRRILAAMRRVPRHEFVPEEYLSSAYQNRPLPIGHGQTISQPFIVALMTDLLRLRPSDTVLEVGTGCGYQTAVLAHLAQHVYSIEIVEPLGRAAAVRLARLGYANVTTRIGDGYLGWEEKAPFDAIIVAAAAGRVPPALVAQLKPGGRLVIPVGEFAQELMVIDKHEDGTTTSTDIIPVRFVPLTREGD